MWFGTYGYGVSKYNPNVGINDLKENETKVCPNPATTKITFINSSLNRGSICIYDAIGQCILQQKYNLPETTIKLEVFKIGIYFYTLSDTGGKFYSGKFIKE